MGFLDFLFGKKEEVQEEVEIIQKIEVPDNYEAQGVCHYCDTDIKTNEKMKKFAKEIFHRKCFKKMRKDATKVAFG